jgi:glutamate/tyrosine decarboxylase-like PLP-dependent enzyme
MIKLQLNKITCRHQVFGAFDDLNAIADVCEKYNLWLHVDACLGGSAILSSNQKHLLKGKLCI